MVLLSVLGLALIFADAFPLSLDHVTGWCFLGGGLMEVYSFADREVGAC